MYISHRRFLILMERRKPPRNCNRFLLLPLFVKVTALTKVLLQGRRFFRPFHLETRGLRRLLHPFADLISFCGVAIVLAAFIIKDVLGHEEKNLLTGVEKLERAYGSGIDRGKNLRLLHALEWKAP